MIDYTYGESLPGYLKKSFSIPYNGGEIWFEHLDGIYGFEDLVIKKLQSDISKFSRPSSSSYICFVFDETVITDSIISETVNAILLHGKRLMKTAFCGVDRKSKKQLMKFLSNKGFTVDFFEGLEFAKQWLL